MAVGRVLGAWQWSCLRDRSGSIVSGHCVGGVKCGVEER